MIHPIQTAIKLQRKIRLDAFRSLAPGKIRVAPYVQVAAVTRYLLYGRNTEADQKKLEIYIGPELAKETVETGSYYDLTTRKDQIKRFGKTADV